MIFNNSFYIYLKLNEIPKPDYIENCVYLVDFKQIQQSLNSKNRYFSRLTPRKLEWLINHFYFKSPIDIQM